MKSTDYLRLLILFLCLVKALGGCSLSFVQPPLAREAKLLFKSGFEPATYLGTPSNGWQDLLGTDQSTGYTWPISAWAGTSGIQLLTPAYTTQIQTVTGHDGTPTHALYQSVNGLPNGGVDQIPLRWDPANSLSQQTDFYTSAWIKFQPDLSSQLTSGQMPNGNWGNWRALWEWKSAGDFRIVLSVSTDSNGLYWSAKWDNNANGGLAYRLLWSQDNRTIPVPAGQWFHLTTFTHRADDDTGRWWTKINGRTLFDHYGPNIGVNGAPINRVFLSQVYTNGNMPAYQWTDDVEIWDGVPTDDGEMTLSSQSPLPQASVP